MNIIHYIYFIGKKLLHPNENILFFFFLIQESFGLGIEMYAFPKTAIFSELVLWDLIHGRTTVYGVAGSDMTK